MVEDVGLRPHFMKMVQLESELDTKNNETLPSKEATRISS